MDDAADLLRRFSGHEPTRVMRVSEPNSQALLGIGKLDFVGYTTVRDGKRERYVHEFGARSRPLLASSHDGKELRIVGGQYAFTEEGIKDK